MGSCYSRTRSQSTSEVRGPSVGKNRTLKKKLPKWTYDPRKCRPVSLCGSNSLIGDSCLLTAPYVGLSSNHLNNYTVLTMAHLEKMRAEFWDTAPAFEGRKEIWDALKAASTAIESEQDFTLAQAIVDGANITLPRGTLSECYDELGNRYKIPAYCLAPPTNLAAPTSQIYPNLQTSHHRNSNNSANHQNPFSVTGVHLAPTVLDYSTNTDEEGGPLGTGDRASTLSAGTIESITTMGHHTCVVHAGGNVQTHSNQIIPIITSNETNHNPHITNNQFAHQTSKNNQTPSFIESQPINGPTNFNLVDVHITQPAGQTQTSLLNHNGLTNNSTNANPSSSLTDLTSNILKKHFLNPLRNVVFGSAARRRNRRINNSQAPSQVISTITGNLAGCISPHDNSTITIPASSNLPKSNSILVYNTEGAITNMSVQSSSAAITTATATNPALTISTPSGRPLNSLNPSRLTAKIMSGACKKKNLTGKSNEQSATNISANTNCETSTNSNKRHKSSGSLMINPNAQPQTMPLKLRIGTSGRDLELICMANETVLEAKRKLAKIILKLVLESVVNDIDYSNMGTSNYNSNNNNNTMTDRNIDEGHDEKLTTGQHKNFTIGDDNKVNLNDTERDIFTRQQLQNSISNSLASVKKSSSSPLTIEMILGSQLDDLKNLLGFAKQTNPKVSLGKNETGKTSYKKEKDTSPLPRKITSTNEDNTTNISDVVMLISSDLRHTMPNEESNDPTRDEDVPSTSLLNTNPKQTADPNLPDNDEPCLKNIPPTESSICSRNRRTSLALSSRAKSNFLTSVIAAQKWLFAGKVMNNKVTLRQAKIPKGFVIQVALCI